MTKKTAHIVNQTELERKVLPNKISSDFNVPTALRNSFGKDHSTKNTVRNIGLDYGCKKVCPCDSCFTYLATANQSLNESKTIGLIKHPTKPLIMEHIST